MTPQEKANNLFTKFVFKGAETKQIAIKSALIVVDEILNNDNNLFCTYSQNDYWLQVKKEIENL